MRSHLAVGAVVFALIVPALAFGQAAGGQKPAGSQPKPGARAGTAPASAADEAAIRALSKQYQDAFNANEAAKAANIFAEDAVFVDVDGRTLQGRTAIEQDLAGQSGQRPRLTLTVDAVRFIKPDVALLRGSSQVEGGNVPAGQGGGHWAAVAMKAGGQWKVVAVQAAVNPPTTGRGR